MYNFCPLFFYHLFNPWQKSKTCNTYYTNFPHTTNNDKFTNKHNLTYQMIQNLQGQDQDNQS
jgi:hypothetical protein